MDRIENQNKRKVFRASEGYREKPGLHRFKRENSRDITERTGINAEYWCHTKNIFNAKTYLSTTNLLVNYI